MRRTLRVLASVGPSRLLGGRHAQEVRHAVESPERAERPRHEAQPRIVDDSGSTSSIAGDLEQLLRDGSVLLQQPAARALFGVLLSESVNAPPEVRDARRRFWRAHADKAQALIDRAIARRELPPDTDPLALIDLVIGPALVRLLLLGRELQPEETYAIVQRALSALRT